MGLRFDFDEIVKDQKDELEFFFQYTVNIDTQFSIFIDDELFLYEPNFPILELSFVLAKWKKDDFKKKESFFYRPIDFDEQDYLWLKHEDGGWKIGAAWQKFECTNSFTDDYIEGLVDEFLSRVIKQTRHDLGFNANQIIYSPHGVYSSERLVVKKNGDLVKPSPLRIFIQKLRYKLRKYL